MNDRALWCLIASVLVWRSTALAADSASPVQPNAVLDNPLAVHSLAGLQATRDRPLFAPTRRPPPPPPPPPTARVIEPPPPEPPGIILVGIVIDGTDIRAMVRADPSAKIIRARLGDDIAGWKVEQIDPRRLVLAHDDRSVTFTLFGDKGAKDKADPAAALTSTAMVGPRKMPDRSNPPGRTLLSKGLVRGPNVMP